MHFFLNFDDITLYFFFIYIYIPNIIKIEDGRFQGVVELA